MLKDLQDQEDHKVQQEPKVLKVELQDLQDFQDLHHHKEPKVLVDHQVE